MILSEAEAKKKWCAEARAVVAEEKGGKYQLGDAKVSFNRILRSPSGEQADYGTCIASKCMSWRWAVGDGFGKTNDVRTHGYCGKGGKP